MIDQTCQEICDIEFAVESHKRINKYVYLKNNKDVQNKFHSINKNKVYMKEGKHTMNKVQNNKGKEEQTTITRLETRAFMKRYKRVVIT
jgi:hypothetical protein